jgi:4a-hydroxytetrahydrobiopterin dehydratase
MSASKLSHEQINERLAALGGWQLRDGKLARELEFESFVDAFGWMSSAALVAESMNHHPNWKNVYSRVSVELSTHDAGGITELDFQLARRMNQLASRYGL